jgi:hypothetical protein
MENVPPNSGLSQNIQLTIDKRSVYLWIAVILANLVLILTFLVAGFSDPSGFRVSFVFGEAWFLALLGTFFFLSTIPVVISSSSGRFKNIFGYGIPVLFLLLLVYWVYDYFTCGGQWCQIGSVMFGVVSGLAAFVSFFFYTLALLARKYSLKFILSVIYIEAFFFLFSVVYLGFRILN